MTPRLDKNLPTRSDQGLAGTGGRAQGPEPIETGGRDLREGIYWTEGFSGRGGLRLRYKLRTDGRIFLKALP